MPTNTASVARSSAGMAFWTMFSRVLGVVRNAMVGAALGLVGAQADAWSTANTIPNIIFLLLAGGVLNAVFIPALTKAAKDEDGGRAYTDRLITVSLLLLGLITVLATVGAPLLVWLYAGGLPPDAKTLAVKFAVICLPQIFFYGLYTVLGQVLNARNRFQEFMWATVVANIVAIAGLALFLALFPHGAAVSDWTWPMILVMAGFTTLSVVVQAVVLIPPLLRDGFRYTPRFDFRGAGLGSASRTAMWIFVSLGMSQLGQLAAWAVMNSANSAAGSQNAGTGVFSQSSQLFMLPHSLIALTIMTALYPVMSRAAADDDLGELRSQLDRGNRMIIAFGLPVTSAMLLLAEPMAAVLYPTLGPSATHQVAIVMVPMVMVLMPYGLMQIAHRVYFALDDAKGAVTIQSWTTLVQLVGVAVVALTVADPQVTFAVACIQAVAHCVGTLVALRGVDVRLRGYSLPGLGMTSARCLLAVLVAAVPAGAAAWVAGRLVDGYLLGNVAMLAAGGTVLLGTYLLLVCWLRVKEVTEVADSLLHRVRRLVPGR